MRGTAGQTLAEKIIARASGHARVSPGDIVTVSLDLAMAHDSSGPRRWRPALEKLGARLWDPARVVIVTDHYVPATDAASAAILAETRRFATDYGVRHFLDMQGICHVVLPEHGLLRPGMMVAGGDSHSCTGGAYGCFMAGFGATDMIGIIVTGQTWLIVPRTLLIHLHGTPGAGVSAKDVMLTLCRDIGTDNAGTVLEFAGPGVAGIGMGERMVLCNMAAELGADTALIAPDHTTLESIRQAGTGADDEMLAWQSDASATFAGRHEIDLSAMSPQVAAPHSPANSAPVETYARTAIDQAYIGACVGAKLEDLAMAAELLRGRHVAAHTRLMIAPASRRITEQAARTGILADLLAAGAILLPSGCGACAGMGAGLLAAGEVCLSTTNRNFRGRMGSPEASVYLASPYTVAASAVAGHIADPRELLGRG